MKKTMILIILMLICSIGFTTEKITVKTVKTEIVKKDTISKAVKIEKAIAVTDSLVKKIEKINISTKEDGSVDWFTFILGSGGLLTVILQWLVNYIPTSKNWTWLRPISALSKLFVGISKGLQWFSNLGGKIPNRKKGGGTFSRSVIKIDKVNDTQIQ
jgi:hypothetical protein